MDVENVGKAARVEHVVSADGKTRSDVWLLADDEAQGTLPSLAKVIQNQVAHIDYFTLYDAKVVSQSADGAMVDLQPGDQRLPGLSKVPLRLGLPGTVVKFAPGQYVRLGWDRGNPQMPYACLFQGGETLTSLEVGLSPDNVATKQDINAVLQYIAGLQYLPGPGAATALSATVPPPVSIGSNIVKVQR